MRLSLMILLSIVGTRPCVAEAAEPLRLRVMTFNLHHGRGDDGMIDLSRIARTINGARPDLVALQEVDRHTSRSQQVDQLERLATETGMHAAFGKAIDFEGGQYGVGVLSKFEITDSQTFPLPGGQDRERRVALEVRLQAPGFPPFIFVCTHFDHHAGDEDRKAQAARIVELFGGGPSWAIVAGDLNARPDSDVLKILGRRWRPVDADRLRPTAPARNPRSKIDYILIETDRPWIVNSSEVLPDRASSDHLPLVAELQYVAPE